MKVLAVTATSERERLQQKRLSEQKIDIRVLLAATILLKARDKDMTACHHLIGLFLHHEGCTKQAFRQLSSLGISTSHTTVLKKMDEVCSTFDQKLLLWKAAINDHYAATAVTLTSQGTCGPTVDFQIVGDNIDFEIHPTLSTLKYKKDSFHWFNSMAVKHRILGNALPDTAPQRSISDFDATFLLPTADDHSALREAFVILVERIFTLRLKAFYSLRDVVNWHIPHKYSSERKKATEVVKNFIQFTRHKIFSLGSFRTNTKK